MNYLKVGTQLRLRPFVSSDGMIRLEVVPERSTGVLDDKGIPQTKSTQVTTNVLVPDGKTIVIGGLLDDEDDTTWEGLPILSRLPWIGFLFRHTVKTTAKKELIVILTPHIWHPECPQGLNALGPPSTLGLEERVAQRPYAEAQDAPNLYKLLVPAAICPNPPEENLAGDDAPHFDRSCLARR